MATSTMITIDSAEQNSESVAHDLTATREKVSDQATNAERAQSMGTAPDKRPLWRRVLITIALLTGVFLVALDVNILGMPTPHVHMVYPEVILPQGQRLT